MVLLLFLCKVYFHMNVTIGLNSKSDRLIPFDRCSIPASHSDRLTSFDRCSIPATQTYLLLLTDVVFRPLAFGVRPLPVPIPVGDHAVLAGVGVVRVPGNPVGVGECLARGQPLEGALLLLVRPSQPVNPLRV